jgi:VWFA-related protein
MPLLRRHFLQSALISPFLPQEARFSADVKVVTLFATARDHKGRIVHDLSREDFQLEEDGRPQTIRYFSRESDLPLKVGIMIDTSRSQYGILEHERCASYTFLDRVLREGKDSAFVMTFDVAVTMLQGFTSSRKELQTALQGADLAKRNLAEAEPPREHILVGTKLYDGVRQAARDAMRPEQGRKALILLTDGVDYGSRSSLGQAVENAQRADTLVHSILYFDPGGYVRARRDRSGLPVPVARRGRPTLQRLSDETGGTFFLVSQKQPVEQVYDRIQDELRNQYSMGYTPDRPDAGRGYRRIRLTLRNKSLTVQARNGYYPE